MPEDVADHLPEGMRIERLHLVKGQRPDDDLDVDGSLPRSAAERTACAWLTRSAPFLRKQPIKHVSLHCLGLPWRDQASIQAVNHALPHSVSVEHQTSSFPGMGYGGSSLMCSSYHGRRSCGKCQGSGMLFPQLHTLYEQCSDWVEGVTLSQLELKATGRTF